MWVSPEKIFVGFLNTKRSCKLTQVVLRSVRYSSLQKKTPRNPESSFGKRRVSYCSSVVLLEVVEGTHVLIFSSGKPLSGAGPFKTQRL